MAEASKSAIVQADNREEKRRLAEAQKAYGRGKAVQTRTIKNQKLKRNLRTIEDKYKDAALKAKFSQNSDAPAEQFGQIKYVFILE